MRRSLALLVILPLIVAANRADEQAVRSLLAQMIAGDPVPPEILDRQNRDPRFPDLEKTIAAVKGCKVVQVEPLQGGSYGVQWHCKGLKRKEQPSAMVIYASDGQVIRILTAVASSGM